VSGKIVDEPITESTHKVHEEGPSSFLTLAEVLAGLPSVEQQMAKELPWRFDREQLTLTGPHWYEINLERLTTSAEVADIVFQISQKGWATDSVLASFVRSLDHLIDPQAHICSFGEERGPIDVRRVVEKNLRAHLAYRRLSN
jgi:hypothetical protein